MELGQKRHQDTLPRCERHLAVHALSIDRPDIVDDDLLRAQAHATENGVKAEALVHHEVDDFKFFMGVCEERDRVSVLIVRQEQPPRCPDELRYAQQVAGLDAPRLHEGLLREQPFHTSVG